MRGMLRTQLDTLVAGVLRHRRLLDHPFYVRWEAGMLARSELARYAGQYRHFEAALPDVLERIVDGLPDGAARHGVEASLVDERGVPAPHLELFDAFAAAVGAPASVEPTPATVALIGLYDELADRAPLSALVGLAVYETQAPHVASSKADGLRAHYGVGPDGTRFWDVHADMDESHAEWALDGVAELSAHPDDLADAAQRAADAWWTFLDEREAEGHLLATA
jgi:pyrroloquinoline-quinone synthase